MTTALYLPVLRTDQWAILQHPAKTKVLAMGRRWGKTFLGGSAALATASKGVPVAWIVPNFKNGAPVWRWAEQRVAPLRASGQVRINQAERTIEFPNGGFLAIYSADNADAIRGEAFQLVILDEAARIPEVVWTDVIQPTLADYDGDAILISTPQGLNWFWQEWLRGQADGVFIASWQAPSSANPNPNIQHAMELARLRVPERTFRQEWRGEFIEDGGSVFRHVRECVTAQIQNEAIPGHQYAFGVDWGKLNDFTVITVLDLTLKAVVHIARFNQIDYEIQLGRLRHLYQRFQPTVIKAERNSIGEPLIERLSNEGLPIVPFLTTNATKQPVMDALALALEQREIAIPDEPILIAELLAFQVERLASGQLRYSAPYGTHDDCVISLALAWDCLDSTDAQDWGAVVWRLVRCSHCGKLYRDVPEGKPCSHCGVRPLSLLRPA
jgi:hypothetical protein